MRENQTKRVRLLEALENRGASSKEIILEERSRAAISLDGGTWGVTQLVPLPDGRLGYRLKQLLEE